ncbi:hypothetical protein FOL47_005551 [Perkinsus chesapeaki]|uniref:Transmembrane protein n=1 Tax=Perkinsus chesapeaki TaxID=330153 RepID=A0A7J6LX51_PERCH|nr:hypothetical protein FOL47_005551 [Perkinsus chesapeaki]
MLYSSPSPSLPFFIYSITSLLSFVVLLKLLPETKGLTLEDSSSYAITVGTGTGNKDECRNEVVVGNGLLDRIKRLFIGGGGCCRTVRQDGKE